MDIYILGLAKAPGFLEEFLDEWMLANFILDLACSILGRLPDSRTDGGTLFSLRKNKIWLKLQA